MEILWSPSLPRRLVSVPLSTRDTERHTFMYEHKGMQGGRVSPETIERQCRGRSEEVGRTTRKERMVPGLAAGRRACRKYSYLFKHGTTNLVELALGFVDGIINKELYKWQRMEKRPP